MPRHNDQDQKAELGHIRAFATVRFRRPDLRLPEPRGRRRYLDVPALSHSDTWKEPITAIAHTRATRGVNGEQPTESDRSGTLSRCRDAMRAGPDFIDSTTRLSSFVAMAKHLGVPSCF